MRLLRGVSWVLGTFLCKGLRSVALVHGKCTCEVSSVPHIVVFRKLIECSRGGITGKLYKNTSINDTTSITSWHNSASTRRYETRRAVKEFESNWVLLSCVRKIAKSGYYLRHINWLYARVEQLGSHWTDFHEISCLRIFRKSIREVQVSLTL